MNPHEMDVYGTVKVGERGQIVIPSGARKELDIRPGSLLLVINTPSRDGIALIKVEIVKRMIEKMNRGLTEPGEPDREPTKRKTAK